MREAGGATPSGRVAPGRNSLPTRTPMLSTTKARSNPVAIVLGLIASLLHFICGSAPPHRTLGKPSGGFDRIDLHACGIVVHVVTAQQVGQPGEQLGGVCRLRRAATRRCFANDRERVRRGGTAARLVLNPGVRVEI